MRCARYISVVFYLVILDESPVPLSLGDLATLPIRLLATLCAPSGLLSSSSSSSSSYRPVSPTSRRPRMSSSTSSSVLAQSIGSECSFVTNPQFRLYAEFYQRLAT